MSIDKEALTPRQAVVLAAAKRRSKHYQTTAQLAAQLAVSERTIRRTRRALAVCCSHARSQARRSRVYIQAAVVGLSATEIGRREGVTHKQIERDIREMGIQAECQAARARRKAELKNPAG